MATDLKYLRKDELMVLLVEAIVSKKTDNITAFSNELMSRIPDSAEPGPIVDIPDQCLRCEGEHLIPDGGGNPIPGQFVPMDGGGVAFQEDIVPDGGDQARITGGNPPKCPNCDQLALPDGAIYRCPNCGNEIGVS